MSVCSLTMKFRQQECKNFCSYTVIVKQYVCISEKLSKKGRNFFTWLPVITDSKVKNTWQSCLCSAWELREGDRFYKEGFWQRAHWCQASPKGHNPGEWGGSQREAFLDKKNRWFSLQLWPTMLWMLRDRLPDSHTLARVTDCLWLIDWKSLCIS